MSGYFDDVGEAAQQIMVADNKTVRRDATSRSIR